MDATRRRVSLAASIALLLAASPSLAVDNGTWSSVSITSALPLSRVESSSVYDPVNRRWLVFGGSGYLGDLWALDLVGGQAAWANITPAVGPSPRRAAAMVFDPLRNRIILFGGDDGTFRNDVWVYNLTGPGAWTQLTPAGPPPPGRMHTLAVYDPLRDRLLIYGGYRSELLSDTWALNLSGPETWEQVIAGGPGPQARWSCVGAYDPVGDRLVMALGLAGDYRNDVWELRLSGAPTWNQLTPLGAPPSPRFLTSGAFDSSRHKLIVYGGYPGGADEVWELDIAPTMTWTQLGPAGTAPAGRRAHVAIFDTDATRMLTLGGVGMDNNGFALAFTPTPTALPAILAFTPLGGPAATDVRITGYNLDTVTLVEFNDTAAPILAQSAGEIQTRVPAGATTGKIRVTGPAGSALSGADFVVGELPRVDAAVPDSGRARARILITGKNFTAATRVTFGGAGSPTFTVTSDSTIVAIVDTFATTGPIYVFAPPGAGQSAFTFRYIPPDPRPRMKSVRDVPRDQGGHVVVRWEGSDFDVPWRRVITGYRVWRRAPATASSSRPTSAGERFSHAPGREMLADVYWESIAELPAATLEGYAYTASTPFDSSDVANEPVAFFVQALTADRFVTYSSSPDSGWSVDDLAPPQPAPFAAEYSTFQVALHWRTSPAPDFREFRLYGGASPTFAIGDASLVATTRDTAYLDVGAGVATRHYKLVALDVHGNTSRVALVSPDVPVAALAAFVSAEPTERRIRLTWYAGGNPGLAARLERSEGAGGWVAIAELHADATGLIRYEDEDVRSGARYGYRLAIENGDAITYTDAIWVTAETPSFALLGPWPNPTLSGRFQVAFELPSTEPATLELWDIAGRRVERRSISPAGGRRVVDLGAEARLEPGVYLLRMSQGDRRVQRRVVVLE